MADDAYRLGQTGIAAYLQALQATRDVRLRFLQSEADLQTALADLEQAIGAPLQP
jgi:outer membrane protein TolC